ncbi:MAG TPA: phosphoglycerate dehydrogenase [Candidatus Lokiarchaeia archaeon]|nr:phosphoglycerate dehydrogenase [Candidatus Lokiarchaeia archaeon]
MFDERVTKDRLKILLLEGIHESAVKNFEAAGFQDIEMLKTSLSEDELVNRLPEISILGIRSRTQITDNVLNAAKNLLVLGCFCIGTNQVDLTTAMYNGVPVFNGPYSNTRSVAELVLGEMIMLLRGIPEKNFKAHDGEWSKSASNAYEMRHKKLGIIGYGNIGTQLSVMAEAIGMHVYFYDIIPKLPHGNAIQVPNLKKLLSECDVITLHVPETPMTKNMIGAEEFATMKEGSVFINASRGTVVDLDALAEALRSGHLAGAAIDVYPEEPNDDSESFVTPLQEFKNCILTPHIAGSTKEAQEHIGEEVSQKLINFVDYGSTLLSVNFPQVSLLSSPGLHRVLHIHRNIPGVLSAINGTFSEAHVNIAAQYLQTNPDIGYVVTDVEADYSPTAIEQLRNAPGTIRVRVIS